MTRRRSAIAVSLVALALVFAACSGDDGSGESHFTVEIESATFAGVNRVLRQRMVNKALGDLPGEQINKIDIRGQRGAGHGRDDPRL